MTVALLALIVFSAFLVEATLGFGATIVTVTLGVFLYPIDVLLPAFVPINMLLSLYIVLRYRHAICWRLLLRRTVPMMALGMPAGMLLFHAGSSRLLKILFGAFVVGLSALELVRMTRHSQASPKPLKLSSQVLLLAAGGVVHGAYAAGGPMAVYVAGRELPDKRSFRSTLCMLWFVLNSALVVSYAVSGVLNSNTAHISLYLLAPLIAGLVAGEWFHDRVNAAAFRALVFMLLLVAGGILVASA
jgi:uncharacterized membrane protein YfcA